MPPCQGLRVSAPLRPRDAANFHATAGIRTLPANGQRIAQLRGMASLSGPHSHAALAPAMAACAGFVDLVCFLRLAGVFSSFMTGNTSRFAYFLDHQGFWTAAPYGWAIVCFVMGLMCTASLTHLQRRRGIRSSFAAVLILEDVLLAVYIWLSGAPSSPLWLLVFLTCFAMGMQTVTVTHFGTVRLWTTFQTGNLAQFSEAFAAWLFWFWDRTRGRFRRRLGRVLRVSPRQCDARHAAATLVVWLSYFAGAAAGSGAEFAWGAVCLWIPIVALAAVALLDWKSPTALGEPSDKP